ncbi:hypothetical protein SDRG_13734 [Saprolegnia diclina VS20]|uniref:Polycystin cation channel PKD1/PKD2 domain-containing protein n=1 Tax=Saprolegnia diclina (strain VS20) TaxID=1156394 RepID=T0Q4Q8_SAPDV|nr:hypothetical protein SDRG_13734 [Saprolegnia diclina VS20]EQC28405.1 hypothetical protein SDRG_13734 [Saprolegnia diclina VS20]|eukprot:XP_008618053.1 hypothetical protein SDRG_13734 [Saprolegnia diclina VS20]
MSQAIPGAPHQEFDLHKLKSYAAQGFVRKATKELNKCVIADDKLQRGDDQNPNRGFHYALLREVYGNTGDAVKDTVLFSILPQVESKELLNHKVMGRVLAIKWQTFACCMNLQQIMLYLLLLMTLTLSVTMDLGDGESPTFHTQLLVWLNVGVALVLGLIATSYFHYANRKLWAVKTIGVIGLVLLALNFCADSIAAHVNWIWFVRCNNVVLTPTALFFIRFEISELYGEIVKKRDTQHLHVVEIALEATIDFFLSFFGRNASHYFNSFFNKVQLPTFVAILVFVITETFYPCGDDVRLYFGIIITFAAWSTSIQYLEIHGTAGYLISLMTFMLNDVVKFMAFYLPFQCAYAISYYLLFEGRGVDAYATIAHSFVTTFLVMLGQIELEPFENLPAPGPYVLGYTLLLTHATLVIVMLLNVLIAMLNKSMDKVMEKAKLEVRVSFAECILRNEKVYGLRPMPEQDPCAALAAEETRHLLHGSHGGAEIVEVDDAEQNKADFTTLPDDVATLCKRLDESEKHNARLEAMLQDIMLHLNIAPRATA